MTDLSQPLSNAINALAFASDPLFNSALSQHARLITLETAQRPGLPDALVVEGFTGHEAINTLFSFNIDGLSLSTSVDLKQFIGEEITLRLLQADGSRRVWHGLCTQAQWLGADGGIAHYHLRLESFLSLFALRRDSFIFQDKDTQQIVTELMADYPQANVKWDVTRALPIRPICTQYRETDLEFFTRLLASDGLSWRFEHEQDSATADVKFGTDKNTPHARHQLVIFDSYATAPDMPGDTSLRFHAVRATEASDSINQFSAVRQVQSNAVSVSSWDFAQVSAPASEQTSSLANGDLPELAIYDGAAERRYQDSGDASDQNELHLQAHELNNKTFSGAGAVRQLAAGHTFNLSQHAHYAPGNNTFTVLAVDHAATNNFDAGIARLLKLNDLERGTYRNQFSCLRDVVPVVPALAAIRRSPTALGTQVALVVGLEGAPLTTDRDHRIKVQFAWQRGVAPMAGGANDTGTLADSEGNAPGNDTSGTWVRVSEALSGANWGSNFTPRVGVEVLVDFIEADMDRPVIVAQLYNGNDTPPFSAGVDSGVNHAGYLSGIHTHNLDDGGYNQWVLDDTQAQLRMRLASSTATSQLNLGYLIAQSPTSAQRGHYRGQGFELRTDAWGMLRGAEGVLLSTMTRSGIGASVTSTQMDVQEGVAQLKGAKALGDALGKAATHQTALISKDANKAQVELTTAVDQQQKGKYSGSVNGQQALKARSGSRDLDSAQPVEKFASAIVHLEAPSNINLASPASTALFAGQHIHWTTQADMHWAAAHTVAAVSGNATTLFSNEGGIQLFAGNGPLSLQAHTDQLEILADKEITVISINEHIVINANKKITLMAGQSSVTLEDVNITFACPGKFVVQGGLHEFDKGAKGKAELGKLPDTRVKLFDEGFVVKDPDGRPVAGMPYRIKLPDGTFEEGTTSKNGKTHIVLGADPEQLELQIMRGTSK